MNSMAKITFGCTVLIEFSCACAAYSQSLRTVALTAAPAPGGGNYGTLAVPALNNWGEVVFSGSTIVDTATLGGIWSEGGGDGLQMVARDGELALGGPTGSVYQFLQGHIPALNDSGQVFFFGSLMPGVGGVTTSNNSAAWIADAGQPPQMMLREGVAAPGTSGPLFNGFDLLVDEQSTPLGAQGEIAVRTMLRVTSPGVTTSSDTGIWLAGGSSPAALVAREGDLAPEALPERYNHMSAYPRINGHGQIAYFARLLPSGDHGIWIGDAVGGFELMHRSGETAPGVSPAVAFAGLGIPRFNNAGEYAFIGELVVGGDVDGLNDTGLWVRRGADELQLLVREGQVAPGTGSEIGFGSLPSFTPLVLDGGGNVVLVAPLQDLSTGGTAGLTTENDTGIWRQSAESSLQLLVREDSLAPGTEEGTRFASFVGASLGGTDQVVFGATLRGAAVDTANDVGIWAQDRDGVLHLIAREGNMIDVDDGPGVDERVVSQLGLYLGTGNQEGLRSGFNEKGQLGLLAVFTDGSRGVFVSNAVARLDLLGDYNGNGIVDAADYTVWRDTLGQLGANLAADGTGPMGVPDGVVDQLDYALWKANFGLGTPGAGSAASTAAVPEPTATWLLFLGSLFVRRTRRTGGLDEWVRKGLPTVSEKATAATAK
jgi:hypothetical protein